ncbi:DNA adenine methylase [Halocalculus aciditolerans]|uniref:site-specific DNA-methyltransferase (adenine-specific) n=1 Tax=Halocalculus aciditolerans TaxID=1383812 RepID=A0A830FKE9_9EURY|nr:DNA adenine methylase [Halocalculus aciditolerans]GGL55262.1 DNA methyltransferase [Halocalculus aciditolerans]
MHSEDDTERSGRKLSAFPYIGSKTYLAPWVVEHLRDHETFVVPFGGAAGVLLNKPRSHAEIFNDRDEYVAEFFDVVRTEPDALASAVENIPYSRGLYNEWSRRFRDPERDLADDRVEEAARWVFLRYASFSGRYGQRAGFATDTPRKGPQKSEIWARVPDRIQLVRDRFKGVAIECGDYSTLFERYDGPDVLFYCDPPYVEEKSGYYRGPLFDHAAFVEALDAVDGHWAVSYSEPPAGLADLATAVVERDYSRSASLDNSTRPERLYFSYDPTNAPRFVNASTAQATLAQTDGGRSVSAGTERGGCDE